MERNFKLRVATTLKASLLGAALLCGGSNVTWAQDMPTTIDAEGSAQLQSLSDEQIAEKLQSLGFSDIRDERLSGAVYEATADWQGRMVDLTVDLDNGAIAYGRAEAPATATSVADRPRLMPEIPPSASAEDVAAELEALGFENVSITEAQERGAPSEPRLFEGTAEWQDETVAFTVDSATGSINYATAAAETTGPRVVIPQGTAIPTRSGEEMDADYVRQQLLALGFTDVQEIKESGEIFETAARLNGQWVQLTIDGENGGIMQE